jgi:ADP-heptose:LPS heptosyltransferase
LQKEIKDCDKEFFRCYKNIRFFGDDLKDFSDTAALIENVDLVISTCTSIPHLCGALGKEAWVLLSHVPDWRWLLDREDSPWYPSIKLYRQPHFGNLSDVLDKIIFDLNARKNLY